MDSIFINCENSKTSDPHRLLLNLSDKLNMLLYQTLVFTIHGKIKKSYTKIKNLEFREWRVWITWWIIFCIRYSKLF